MSKIAMFGGSFNPVHNGHTALVQRMIEEFELDKVYVIPTYISPLKDNSLMLHSDTRLHMCRLAFEDIDKVTVSDIEILRKGQSYTVDTLKSIREMHPCDELFLIVGADSFLQLPEWYHAQEIFSLATVVVSSRGVDVYNELVAASERYKEEYNASTAVVNTTIAHISSTEIRDNINDKNISSKLNKKVYEYIARSGLYGCKVN